MIFDLYSGTGTIAQMLAPVAKKVVGVEIVEEAVEAARMSFAEFKKMYKQMKAEERRKKFAPA